MFYFDITINKASADTIKISVCSEFTTPKGNQINKNGFVKDSFLNTLGCDSLVTYDIKLNETKSARSVVSCSYYITPAGKLVSSSGIYIDTLVNSNGCDSLLTIDVEIVRLNTSVSQLGGTLVSEDQLATYQWLDCNDNWEKIPSETKQIFKPANNGIYALELSNKSRLDTSSCLIVSNLDVAQMDGRLPVLKYKNPQKA